MPTDLDQDILDLVDAERRNEALRLLMERHSKALYRYIRAELRNHHAADDVLARVFIEADRDIAKFARRSPLRAWLFAIARHRVLDARKSQLLDQAKHTPLNGTDAPDGTASVSEQLDEEHLRRVLMDCLDQLHPRVRQAVLLRYQGHSFEEIAKILGERAGTVQARVTRALPKLKECIEKRTGRRV